MSRYTILFFAISAMFAYGTNDYIDLDTLDRQRVSSQNVATKHHDAKQHANHKRLQRFRKHPRARTPEALINKRPHTKRSIATKGLVRHGYDRWNAPEALIDGTSYAHRYSRRGWVLAYRYDKASFVDRYGYRYDWFDRFGFTFEGYYFPYNTRYRYRDRLRGRGYFDRLYYAPLRARYYGFCP